MTVNRRTLLKSAGASSTIVALAGCVNVSEDTQTPEETSDGGGDDTPTPTEGSTPTLEPGTLTFWHSRTDQGGNLLANDTKTFNDATPHTVKLADIADLKAKTTSAIPAGDGPLVFEFAHDWVGDYWERGFLSDQSDDVNVDVESTYTPAAQDAVQYKGNLVGLPYAAETVAMMYNKDMVDKPPETLSEAKSIMEDHHDPSNNQYGLGYFIDPYFISGYAHAFGGYYFDPESEELGLTKEETLKGFRVVLDELLPYMPKDTGWGPQAAVFLEGRAPLHVNGPWFMSDVSKNDIDVGLTKLPVSGGGTAHPYTGIKTWYFSKKMNEDVPPNAGAARRFAEWYTTSEDILVRNAKDLGYIPVHEDIVGRDDLGEAVNGFARSVSDGVGMPTNPKMQAVWAEVGPAFTKAQNGDASLEDAMTMAEKRIREEWES